MNLAFSINAKMQRRKDAGKALRWVAGLKLDCLRIECVGGLADPVHFAPLRPCVFAFDHNLRN